MSDSSVCRGRPDFMRQFGTWTVFFCGALALAWIGFACRVSPDNVSVFWPASGLLLAALIFAPYPQWPVFLLLATLATWLADVQWFGWEWHSWLQRISLASVAETALGAYLLRRILRVPSQLDRLTNALSFVLLMTLVGAAVGSLIGAVEVAHLFPETPRWSIFQRWWFGDVLGLVVVTPVLLHAYHASPYREADQANYVEAGVVALITILLTHSVFSAQSGSVQSAFDLPYVLIPFLLWSSLRSPPWCASLTLLIVTSMIVYYTAHSRGPFVSPGHTRDEHALAMQAFLAVSSTASLLMTAVVSDRRRTMEKLESAHALLRESETRYRNVVQDQTELIVRWLPDGTRVFVNDAYCRYHAQLRNALLGTSRWESICDEDRESIRARIQTLTPDHSALEMEYRVRRHDGEIGWQQWIDRGFFNEAGQLVELQSVGRDITQRRLAEEKLARQDAMLHQFSRVATLGELAAGLSHELSQPLSAIGNWVQTLLTLQQNLTQALREQVDWIPWKTAAQGIAVANQQAMDILRRVKGFVKPTTMERRAERISDIIDESISLVSHQLQRKGIQIRVDVDPHAPDVYVDRVQIEQLLVNLLTNAAQATQAMPLAMRVVRVRARRIDQENVQIGVMDQGPGLPPHVAEHLGEPFHTTKSDGMGLGLSICQKIADAHGGKFLYQPVTGGGSEFLVTLPVANRHG